MNTTNTLPPKLARAVCTRCRIESPIPMMREEGTFHVCRNDVACRKRQSKHKPATMPSDAGPSKTGAKKKT